MSCLLTNLFPRWSWKSKKFKRTCHSKAKVEISTCFTSTESTFFLQTQRRPKVISVNSTQVTLFHHCKTQSKHLCFIFENIILIKVLKYYSPFVYYFCVFWINAYLLKIYLQDAKFVNESFAVRKLRLKATLQALNCKYESEYHESKLILLPWFSKTFTI